MHITQQVSLNLQYMYYMPGFIAQKLETELVTDT